MSEQELANLAKHHECRNPSQVANFIMKDLMVNKANSSSLKILLLGILAGIFIGFGCEITTLVAHDATDFFGFGVTRLLAGASFSVGLMLVVIAGAELFTGNTLISGAVLEGYVSKTCLLKNWITVYTANFIGSILLAIIVCYSNTWQQHDSLVGAYAIKTAAAKINLTFLETFTRGILCNCLVCLAIWMASASKNVIGKIFAIFFPIMTFSALGYEHCVANMFFITKAILLVSKPGLATITHLNPDQLSHISITGFMHNLIPATLGNIVGSVLFLVCTYWLAYVKKHD